MTHVMLPSKALCLEQAGVRLWAQVEQKEQHMEIAQVSKYEGQKIDQLFFN